MTFDKSNIGKDCYINLSQEVFTEDSALGTIIGYYNDSAEEYYFVSIIPDSNKQKGDLVFFKTVESKISHVGIYIGGGQIIHAANPSRGVTTDTINSGYYCNNYVGARRVL